VPLHEMRRRVRVTKPPLCRRFRYRGGQFGSPFYVEVVNHFGPSGMEAVLSRVLPLATDDVPAEGEAARDILAESYTRHITRLRADAEARRLAKELQEASMEAACEASQAAAEEAAAAATAAAAAAAEPDAASDSTPHQGSDTSDEPADADADATQTGAGGDAGSGAATTDAGGAADSAGGSGDADAATQPSQQQTTTTTTTTKKKKNMSSAHMPGAEAPSTTPEMLHLDELSALCPMADVPTRAADSALPSVGVVRLLVEAVANTRNVLSRPWGLSFVLRLRDAVCACLLSVPDRSLREVTREVIGVRSLVVVVLSAVQSARS